MAITQCITNIFKQKILDGSHDAADTFKIALYTSSATLDATTAAYTETNEVTGTGYTAGGATLSGFSGTLSGSTGVLDWADPSWTTSTITARGALIYNSTDSTTVMVLDFGSDKSSSGGTFTVVFPVADASTGLIRVAAA